MIGYAGQYASGERYIRIYVHDIHQEYTGSLMTRIAGGQTGHLNAEEVWDDMSLTQSWCDANGTSDWDKATEEIAKVRRSLFPNWPEEWDIGVIWAIEGDLEGLTICFNSLAEALDADISGDDDVFDYWPNTMNMLQEFAQNLDFWHGYWDFSQKVEDVYRRVKARFEAKEAHRPEEHRIKFDEEVWSPNG